MLDMKPPPQKKMKAPVTTHRFLLTKDTGVTITLDLDDWNKAKDVIWYQKGEQIVNGQGTELRVYLGIEFFQLFNVRTFDYRRKND